MVAGDSPLDATDVLPGVISALSVCVGSVV